ncbi:jg6365 [Pararge aegeria aegeria]|uniref:MORN repeat-containing protein 5 n=1 Tax=Pararge aegeria aegeria TaxID=348720 RepID=A0A8S4RRJ4_9NEOP|nr:jg6365 [Pararge aegeria aegeria]
MPDGRISDVIYEGEFDDGMFHGRGDLIYPSGVVLRGTWKKGKMTERKLVFADGLEYDEVDWKYCKKPDRRFTIEYEKGLQPAGKSFMTAEQPTRPIPPGFYDSGDGFYDPETKAVYKVDDLSAIVRSPSVREQKWIIENCRTSPDKPLGPRGYLYEEWVEPLITLPRPPKPSSASQANDSVTLSQFIYEQDREMRGTVPKMLAALPLWMANLIRWPRSPSVREQKWIIENCRTSPDKPLGPRGYLYEEWVEPLITLPRPPKPSSASQANDSVTLSQFIYEQDREMEVAFENLEDDESFTSSSTESISTTGTCCH